VLPGRWVRIVFAFLDLLTAAAVTGFMSIVWSATPIWPVALGAWAAILIMSAIGLVSATELGVRVARFAAVYQLAFFAVLVVGILSSVAYLWGTYGQIGAGLAATLLLILAVLFELVALLPVFKLRSLRIGGDQAASWGKYGYAASLVAVLGVLTYCASVRARASLPPVDPIEPDARAAMGAYLMAVIDGAPLPQLSADVGRPGDRWVLRMYRRGRLEARHEVTGTLAQATEALASELDRRSLSSLSGRALAIDRVVGEIDIEGRTGVVGALSIVPGLDGVSGEVSGTRVTLTPHEMVVRRMLSEYTPVPFIRDFEVGADPEAVRKALCETAGQASDCGARHLRRARTESWTYKDGIVHDLYRARPVDLRRPSAHDAKSGAIAAGYYALRSLRRDGRFVYKLYPDTGRQEIEPYNTTRHAGTAWFLLELYEATGKREFLKGSEKALDWLRGRMGDCGAGLRCIDPGNQARLGPQALSLIAFSTHARTTGSDRYREVIDALAETVARFQRDDGDFDFLLDTRTADPIAGDRVLYAGAQAVLGLALSGQVTGNETHLAAAGAGLDFLAGPYWDFFVSDFFFIEEHWTCLAADELHRLYGDPNHARLCMAAARFDRQLQHRRDETVFPDYVGGIGFTPFFPPYTTNTAGRTEGMVAAYRISQRQGHPDPELRRGIEDAVGFLLHNQYKRGDTYPFRNEWAAVGGVPWSYYDPVIRIDSVQHTGSVLLHGSKILSEQPPN